ncbi:MAG: hypothetical protein A3F83_16595 [Candidatus Glassbacteria bacterium RIFCSPLOWO2_12_FULL_58_11]|uniref:Uncharacterized protein n=1 Tax=Candidatus Glassbacteria bacterium RIFCSPLOWO2_12_FULL_58_11 TaxID=1817867 RepID=A0A1F5Z3D7_9BACT|nr:MAG: hypothetical protein A3F83_16595 [Candidatus Glassbacteria bacterium RIFCSPLOWO2_12_FULL_58_11]
MHRRGTARRFKGCRGRSAENNRGSMDEEEFEKRLGEVERRIRQTDKRLNEISARESRLHNLVLRLAATGMALSEALQRNKLISPAEFEKRVETHLKSLDQEISEKKTSQYLDNLWKELEGGKG